MIDATGMDAAGIDVMVQDRLRSLAIDYAAAVDGRNSDLLRSLFVEDAVLTVEDLAAGTARTREGLDAIAAIPAALADRYPVTFHVLGQCSYAPGPRPETASGEVVCVAHHHVGALGAAAIDRVLHIRYLDRYTRLDDVGDRRDGWRISARTVQVQFTTEQPIPEVRP